MSDVLQACGERGQTSEGVVGRGLAEEAVDESGCELVRWSYALAI